ncbi:MAG: hypothetical protein FWE67_09545 [Planctomycetaceae bacterium]|nr:hypothetical protein [Planctomycetaceae bacterium]
MKKFVSLCFVALLSVSILSLTGCPQPEPAPPAPPTPSGGEQKQQAPAGTTTAEGLKLPMQPTVGVASPAAVFGKTAQEAVPAIPVADLTAQIDEYVKKLEDIDDMDTASRDASALALTALAVGTSKEDSKYKKAAGSIIEVAGKMAKVKTADEAAKLYEQLKAALTAEGPAVQAGIKAAELTPIMKAVPNLSSAVTRQTNTERKIKVAIKDPKKVFAPLAALAAISQGAIANSKDTTPVDEAKWKAECELFRDAALAANAAAHGYADEKVSYDDFSKAFKNMTETCDTCHDIFHKAAKGKTE